MIEIYIRGGISCEEVAFDFDKFRIVMEDSFIPPDSFVHFQFSDGLRGAVRKGEVIGFSEVQINEVIE